MGREVRRVPPYWEHPKRADGQYQPMFDSSFEEELKQWQDGKSKWNEGLQTDYAGGWKPIEEENRHYSWEEWNGDRPDPRYYMPVWPAELRTHYQMYECTTEGTPISPIFETPEELARWLADNEVSSFAGRIATYEQWLRIAEGGFAPSAYIVDGKVTSGVEGPAK